MSRSVLTTLTVLVLVLAGRAQDCLTGMDKGPPLPTFPNQFSVEIEANIVNLNLTLHVTEYYDNINQRGRIDSYSAFGSNVTFVNYDTMEVSHVMTGPDGQKSCMAAPLSTDPSRFARFLFGAQFANGTAHIVPTTQFLMFGAEFNETYIGIETVRGVPCHRWQSCNVSSGAQRNYTIDYYFTQTNWSYNPVMIPFQVVINGTRPNINATDGSVHQVYNVYSFVNFRPGPADDELFRVPPGLPCLGRITGKPLPPLPQDYYTVLYESANPLSQVIVYFREYYGFSQQLYRFDIGTNSDNPLATIEDFNEGVQYSIDNRFGTCSPMPINAGSGAAVRDSNGTFHLQGLKDHFQQQDRYNYTYEGISRVRNVDVESWISLRNNQPLSSIVNYTGFFQTFSTLTPPWTIATGLNSTSNMTVPWRVVIDGNFTYKFPNGTTDSVYQRLAYDMLEFKASEQEYDPFDVSVCFGVDQYTLLRLTLPLPDSAPYASIDHSLLRARIRLALSQAANIPATRLGGINVYDRGNNTLIVNLHVLDAPPISIHPNTVPRDQIVSMLMEKVNSGKVNITLGELTIIPSIRMRPSNTCPSVQPSATVTTTMMPATTVTTTSMPNATTTTSTVVIPNVSVNTVTATRATVTTSVSVITVTSTITMSPTCVKGEESKGLSTGSAIGLSLGMLVIGIIIGIVIAAVTVCVLRRGKSASYKTSTYSRQKDEAVI